MLKKTHGASPKRRRQMKKKRTSQKRKRVYNKKELKEEVAGKVGVHQGGARPLNVLNLKTGEVEEPVFEEIQRPRELTWLDFAKGHESTTNFTNDIGVNFVLEKQKFLIIELLAELPGDFIFFYKNKIINLLKIIQWSLEELGKVPFRLTLGTLRIFIFYGLKPVFKLGFRGFIFGFDFLRQMMATFWWILAKGTLEIVYFPRNVFRFLRPAAVQVWSRNIVVFGIISLLIALPFGAYTYISKLKETQGRVLGVTAEAYDYLQAAQSATEELDFKKANEEFRKANENFLLAQQEIGETNFLLTGIINNLPKGAAAQKILAAGQAIAEAGVYMTEGLEMLHIANTHEFTTNNTNNEIDLGVVEKVRSLQEKFSLAEPRIVLAGQALEEVEPSLLPEDNQENFLEIKDKVKALEKVCLKLKSFSKIISEVLAIDSAKRYLVIFQNETEIRPTGGFMGSLALLDVKEGKIEQMEVPGGGPYDFKASLSKRVAPPRPLQLVSGQWQFQDANWFSDFPASAKKIMWFYENSDGATVDGVMAITSGLVPALLELTGPIEMPEYGKIIDKDNFYLETQLAVEVEYDREENEPKKFIGDLAPRLIDKIINLPSEKMIDLLSVIDLGLTEKKVMFYFTKKEVQAEVLANNWGGEIKKTEAKDDYILVVNSNIGGGKTDGVIEQKIIHETEILENGEMIDTVTIIRSHRGGAGDFFANRRNVDYLRVYVPEGSVLLEAKGFVPLGEEYFKKLRAGLTVDEDLQRLEGNVLVEQTSETRITKEFGKTVFGNWLILDPGETVICKFKYRLPGVINTIDSEEDIYTLLMQKQPGSKEDKIEKILLMPRESVLTWKYPEDEYVGQYEGLVKFRSELDRDKYYGIVFH